MKINEEQLNRQLEGVDKWIDSGCDGIFNYATGVGKTYTSILCVKEIFKRLKDNFTNIVILTTSQVIKEQWEAKIPTYFPQYKQVKFTVLTDSYIQENEFIIECGLLIVDEIHKFSSDERLKLINGTTIKSNMFIGLTANADDKNFSKIRKYRKIIDIITEEEAVEKGFISKFWEYNLRLTLNSMEQEYYDDFTEIINKELPKFKSAKYNSLELAQKVISGGYNRDKTFYTNIQWARSIAGQHGWSEQLNLNIQDQAQINNLWSPGKVIGYAKRLLDAIRGRQLLINTGKDKYAIAIDILMKFKGIKTIVFSESTDYADELYNKCIVKDIRAVIFHSSLKTVLKPGKTGKLMKFGKVRLKRDAMTKFSNGSANVMITAKSLDEGMDDPEIKLGLTTSGSRNSTQYNQRGGRAKRINVNENSLIDSRALIVNLYYGDTVEETSLKQRQRKVTHGIFEIKSVDEISYEPPKDEFSI